MAKCEILITVEDGQDVAGVVVLHSGKILSLPARVKYQVLMKNVIASEHEVDGKMVKREDAEAWFNSLPSHYNGSYLRARMVK